MNNRPPRTRVEVVGKENGEVEFIKRPDGGYTLKRGPVKYCPNCARGMAAAGPCDSFVCEQMRARERRRSPSGIVKAAFNFVTSKDDRVKHEISLLEGILIGALSVLVYGFLGIMAFTAVGLIVAAIVTREWLLIPVVVIPVLAFLWMWDNK